MDKTNHSLHRKKFKLSEVSDEQLLDLMNSVNSDVSDFSSDDEYDNLDFIRHEILPEPENVDEIINLCCQSLNTHEDGPSISNSPPTENISVDNPSSGPEQLPSTIVFKPSKRARSPLPSAEDQGPSIVLSNSSFTCSGIYIAIIQRNTFFLIICTHF